MNRKTTNLPEPATVVSETEVRKAMVDVGCKSINALSIQSDIDYVTIKNMLDGKIFMSSTLDRLAHFLKVDPATLIVTHDYGQNGNN